ncbi:MAG: amidohydrolase family protein [Rikenellaceae bacterium]
MIDIHDFPKIDAHIHISRFDDCYVDIARGYNMRMININTDADVFASPKKQEEVAIKYCDAHANMFAYITTFHAEDYINGDKKIVFDNLDKSLANGAVGVKIWKNIGMELKNSDGEFLMASNPLFNDLYTYIIEHHTTLLAHLGEPKNCWLPLEEMTSERNRLYFSRFPQYHMFLHPNYPSYESHIEARDKIIERFPKLSFVGAHLGSLEWSIDEIAKRLDLYHNLSVDMASRINHLQLQSQKEYAAVRNFVIKYADRLIYGSDVIDDTDKMERCYMENWSYLATDSNECTLESHDKCKGLNLPYEILEKIYFSNAIDKYRKLDKFSKKKLEQK